ncbi:MAG: hypothetical protein SFX73_21105 [Kofleriaceae bacterium]|nr:hypothetical protein [Kofleriaceae bacterium]
MKRHTRHFVSNLGYGTADFAKRTGRGTAALARRVGDGTADIARRVGPKRAVIGVAIFGAVVAGSIVLVRYLKRRREEQMVDYDAIEQSDTAAGMRARDGSRSRRESMRPSGY